MLEVSIVDGNNKKVGTVELDGRIFGQAVNISLVHEAVLMQLNNMRQGTHSTKTKGLVRGGGKKPYKQKGTGRARAGSSRSPVWVGGGTVFGPLPRDYSYSMPKKKMRLALFTVLSSKVKEGTLVVVDSVDGKNGKTKEALSLLQGLNVTGSALVVCSDQSNAIYRGVRNLPDAAIMDVRQLNVYDLVKYNYLVIGKEDIKTLMEVWS